MKTGQSIVGTAVDTHRHEGKECIQLSVNGSEQLVELNAISKLEISIENPHFKQILFS